MNRFGSLAASTHLMVQDALDRGFVAVAIQAKHPLQALAFCRDNGIRAILNHRATEETAAGHYSVFVDINTEHVTFHDPYYGPARRVSNAPWLELWQPRFGNGEIVGNVLIAIGDQPEAAPPCPMCSVVIPRSVECPKCHEPVPLQPSRLLGCVGDGCAGRMWNYVCCRSCDFMWSFSLDAPPPKPPLGPGGEPLSVNSAFVELEKFWAQVMSSEKAANHPEIRKQVEFMKASKEKLALAQVETLVSRKAREAQFSEFQKKCKQAEEAILKRREEIATPGSAPGRQRPRAGPAERPGPPRRAKSLSASHFNFERNRSRQGSDLGSTRCRLGPQTAKVAKIRTLIEPSAPSNLTRSRFRRTSTTFV